MTLVEELRDSTSRLHKPGEVKISINAWTQESQWVQIPSPATIHGRWANNPSSDHHQGRRKMKRAYSKFSLTPEELDAIIREERRDAAFALATVGICILMAGVIIGLILELLI